MEEGTKAKKARHRLLVSVLSLSILFTIGIQPIIPADGQQQSSAERPLSPHTTTTVTEKPDEQPAYSPKGAAGMRVYVDPNTGEILQPPAGAPANETIESQEEEAFSTSSEGLVETPSPVPGGGVILDLQGRFQSPLVATQRPDGQISIEHKPVAPGCGEKK